MRKKYVIRLNRENEISYGWVFLMMLVAIFIAVATTRESLAELKLTFLVGIVIIFVAVLYQGFEIIKEK